MDPNRLKENLEKSIHYLANAAASLNAESTDPVVSQPLQQNYSSSTITSPSEDFRHAFPGLHGLRPGTVILYFYKYLK